MVKSALSFVPAADAETVLKAALVKPTEQITAHEKPFIAPEIPLINMEKAPAVINIQ